MLAPGRPGGLAGVHESEHGSDIGLMRQAEQLAAVVADVSTGVLEVGLAVAVSEDWAFHSCLLPSARADSARDWARVDPWSISIICNACLSWSGSSATAIAVRCVASSNSFSVSHSASRASR